jgi:heme exporter protein D
VLIDSATGENRLPTMEAISAGASVLAFVVLGLQSVKVAHKILSSVKDQNSTVSRAEKDVRRLKSTLERLSSCRIIEERQDDALRSAIEACADDMKTFAEQLRAFDNAHQPGLGKHWNKVKIFLKEGDLAKMSTVVVNYTTVLNFHIGILERYLPYALVG